MDIFIRFASHRARAEAMREWERNGLPRPQAYYSMQRDTGKGVYRVTSEHVEVLARRQYPYGKRWFVRVAGPWDDLHECLH